MLFLHVSCKEWLERMKRTSLALMAAAMALAATVCAFEPSKVVAATGTIEFAFTPGDDAAGLIVRTIDAARTQVLVQTFSFTHREIAEALVRAHERGVDVQVIADREQTNSLDSKAMQRLVDGGLAVLADAEHAAAHNKVMIVDTHGKRPAVITGSFNFTFAAQYRNSENVLVLRDNLDLVRAYFDNWQEHRRHAIAFVRDVPN